MARLCDTVGLNEVRSMRLNKPVRGVFKVERVADGESLREREGRGDDTGCELLGAICVLTLSLTVFIPWERI